MLYIIEWRCILLNDAVYYWMINSIPSYIWLHDTGTLWYVIDIYVSVYCFISSTAATPESTAASVRNCGFAVGGPLLW